MMRKYSLCYVLALYILSVLLLTLGQTQSCDAFRADDRIQSGRISLSTNNNSPQSTDQIKVSLTFPLGDPQSSSCLISPIGIDYIFNMNNYTLYSVTCYFDPIITGILTNDIIINYMVSSIWSSASISYLYYNRIDIYTYTGKMVIDTNKLITKVEMSYTMAFEYISLPKWTSMVGQSISKTYIFLTGFSCTNPTDLNASMIISSFDVTNGKVILTLFVNNLANMYLYYVTFSFLAVSNNFIYSFEPFPSSSIDNQTYIYQFIGLKTIVKTIGQYVFVNLYSPFVHCSFCDGLACVSQQACISNNGIPIQGTCTKNSGSTCDPSCLTCSSIPTECYSCSSAYPFMNPQTKTCTKSCTTNKYILTSVTQSSCLPCKSSCLTCSYYKFCLSCQPSYAYLSTSGYCLLNCPDGTFIKPSQTNPSSLLCHLCSSVCTTCIEYAHKCIVSRCATNCLQCTANGVGKCDNAMCGSGYVLAVDNTCIMCFGGCVLCDMNDPTVCVSCGNGLYLKDNYCFVCSVNCRSCSSNVVCTSCVSGSYLRNGICSDISTSLLACTKKNSIEGCLACVEGYTIINGQCSGYCPDGQYPTILYLTSPSCLICPSACLTCANSTFCFIAKDGYFIINMNMLTNTMTNTQKCSTMCKNCQGTSTKCFSCNDGWRLLGVKCVQITPISVKMYPLSPSTSTVPFSSHLWPSLASSLLGALGINSQTEPYVVFTNPTKDGSFGLLISPQSGSNLPQTVNEVISILNKKTSAFGYGTMYVPFVFPNGDQSVNPKPAPIPPSSNDTNTSPSYSYLNNNSLSTTYIILIVIGVIIGLLLIGGGIVIYYRWKKQQEYDIILGSDVGKDIESEVPQSNERIRSSKAFNRRSGSGSGSDSGTVPGSGVIMEPSPRITLPPTSHDLLSSRSKHSANEYLYKHPELLTSIEQQKMSDYESGTNYSLALPSQKSPKANMKKNSMTYQRSSEQGQRNRSEQTQEGKQIIKKQVLMLPKDYSETYKAYQPTALDSKRQQNVGYSSNLHADVFTIYSSEAFPTNPKYDTQNIQTYNQRKVVSRIPSYQDEPKVSSSSSKAVNKMSSKAPELFDTRIKASQYGLFISPYYSPTYQISLKQTPVFYLIYDDIID